MARLDLRFCAEYADEVVELTGTDRDLPGADDQNRHDLAKYCNGLTRHAQVCRVVVCNVDVGECNRAVELAGAVMGRRESDLVVDLGADKERP